MATIAAPTGKDQTSELDKIRRALDALLAAMVAIDMTPRKGPPEPLRLVSFAELAAGPIPSRRDCQIAAVLREPVRAACRNAIRLLGERLLELLGNTGEMAEIAESLSDGPQYGRRASILDHAWDGIGDWCA
jgi:hypothetical protein